MLQFIKSIPQTFYSRSFYANLINRGTGIGAGFILLQVFLALAVPVCSMFPLLPSGQEKVDAFFDRFPDVTIKDQKLSIDRPSPYVIDVPVGNGKKIDAIVFDTTPHEMNVAEIEKEMKEKKIFALVTADFIAMPKDSSIEITSYRNYGGTALKDRTVNHAQWINIGHKLLVWGAPILFVSMFIFLLIGTFFMTFIKALIVKLLALFSKIKPDLSGAMRLSAAAAIPASLLGLLLTAFGQRLPFLSGALVWLAFAIYGLLCAHQEAKPTTAK
jgi:hypothetical protein